MPRITRVSLVITMWLALTLVHAASYGSQIGETGRAGKGRDLLQSPTGIHASDFDLYVADTGNHRIVLYDLDGKYLGQIGGKGGYRDINGNGEEDAFESGSGTDNEHFTNPRGVYATTDAIYVADTGNNRIMVYDMDQNFKFQIGNLTAGIEMNEFNGPSDVFADSSSIYVVDINNHRVNIFDLQGEYVKQVGVTGTASDSDNTLNMPSGVGLGDFLYIADSKNHRVTYYDEMLEYVGQIGKNEPGTGDLALHSPRGVFIDDDRIYVADTRNNRIGIFFMSGDLDEHIGGSAASEESRLKAPSDVTVTSSRVYVVDSGNHRVVIFNQSTTVSYFTFFIILLLIAGAIGGTIYKFQNELEELIFPDHDLGAKYGPTADVIEESEEMRQQMWDAQE